MSDEYVDYLKGITITPGRTMGNGMADHVISGGTKGDVSAIK